MVTKLTAREPPSLNLQRPSATSPPCKRQCPMPSNPKPPEATRPGTKLSCLDSQSITPESSAPHTSQVFSPDLPLPPPSDPLGRLPAIREVDLGIWGLPQLEESFEVFRET